MKSLTIKIACLAACVLIGRPMPSGAAQKDPIVEARGPTIVAFFELVTQEDLDKNPDTYEALADFQVYAKQLRDRLTGTGIEFHELYVHSFRLRVGKRLLAVNVSKAGVGYCFVTPGKKPRMEYGVMTDSDALIVAKEYFGSSAK